MSLAAPTNGAGNAEASSKRRGSDASLIGAGAKQPKMGLAASRVEQPPAALKSSEFKIREWKPTRPRRERTDGDIMTRRNRAQLGVAAKENAAADGRRLEAELHFSGGAGKARNRNSGILSTQQNFNSSSNQSDDSTMLIQVST